MTATKVGIIGAGPVGSILAARLITAGHKVVLAEADPNRRKAIAKMGLPVFGALELPAPAPTLVESIPDLGGRDLEIIFIALKAPTMRALAGQIVPLLEAGADGVLLQNGLGNEELLAESAPPERVFRVVVNYAGGVTDDQRIQMTFFHPPNHIGALQPERRGRAAEVAALLTSAGLETRENERIRDQEWTKVLLNASLSPVTALTGLTMKQCMDTPTVRTLVEAILREGMAVAEADGAELGDGFFDHGIGYLDTAGHHRPSMWVDLQRGAETEIDFLNGRVVEYGEKHGMPVPINRTITTLIKGRELEARGEQP